MPPVGACVSAFNVISGRWTASAHSPVDRLRAVHSVQKATVASSAASGSIGSGGGRWDGPCVITNGTVAPASTSNSATVVRSRPERTGVRSVTMSGPAIARHAVGAAHHGTAGRGKANRNRHHASRSPRTRRMTSELSARGISRSAWRRRPSPNVSPGRACRRDARDDRAQSSAEQSASARARCRLSRKARSEPKRGQRSRSIDPPRDTSARFSQSPGVILERHAHGGLSAQAQREPPRRGAAGCRGTNADATRVGLLGQAVDASPVLQPVSKSLSASRR